MKKGIIYLLALISLVFSQVGVVQAQSTAGQTSHFAIVEVDIRPEFDRPDVLVIYHIVLAQDVKLPAQVTIRMPARAKEPNAVAWVDPADQGLYNLDYELQVESAWVYVTFFTTGSEISFEYYDPALAKNDLAREFTFSWPGDFHVDDFRLYILPPGEAANVRITPDMGPAIKDSSGNPYYITKLGSITPTDQFQIKIAYERSTDTISAQNSVVEPSAPLDDTTRGRTSINELLPWLAGVLLVILAGFIGWWIWISRRTGYTRNRGNRQSPRIRQTEDRVDNEYHIYCHECGERAKPGDIFCRSCGIKLRRE